MVEPVQPIISMQQQTTFTNDVLPEALATELALIKQSVDEAKHMFMQTVKY